MDLIVNPNSWLRGTVMAPPSKSYTHRALIAGLLSEGETTVEYPLVSDDTSATVEACKLFGAEIVEEGNGLRVRGPRRLRAPPEAVNCHDSGSTLRFLTPVSALTEEGKTITLTGNPGLLRRPIGSLLACLQDLGVKCTSNGGFPPVKVYGGGIRGGESEIVGDVSSQFLTGLFFACPLADEDVILRLTSPLESTPYVTLTLHVLERHSVKILPAADFREFHIRARQDFAASSHVVPGDLSSSAFLLAAAAVTGSNVKIRGIDLNFKAQPDFSILHLIEKMGVGLGLGSDSVETLGGTLEGIVMDARDNPDLVPVIAALGCHARGETRIINAKRLRIKESDRLRALAVELRKMGANIFELDDGLLIEGEKRLRGTIINSHNDHRIAMAATVAALRAEGRTLIRNIDCVRKSYPSFVEHLKTLGADLRYAW